MKSLKQKVAERIDRASQFDDYSGSVFESEDPEARRYKEHLLKASDEIIRMVTIITMRRIENERRGLGKSNKYGHRNRPTYRQGS
jgi:hypothetical protein